jgi:hypothetical protein
LEDQVMDDVHILEAELPGDDEARTAQNIACLTEIIRQLRDMADHLADLAAKPLEGQPPTLH